MSTEQKPTASETDAPQGPGVGVDEWVARSAGRREYAPGHLGQAERLLERLPWWVILLAAGLAGACVPLLTTNDFQLQVGINALLLA
ncbi:MAG: hypothetical protein ACXVXL_02120, partial [Solirubrobacteraceae bacterium]